MFHQTRAGSGRRSSEKTKFWHAGDVGPVELLKATYITHSFSPHVHEGFAIGIIEQGAESFYYRGANHVAPAGSIVLINPDEVHTGQAAAETGWTYRMLYPEADLLQQAAGEASGRRQPGIPYFPRPVVQDPYLSQLIRTLHTTLENSVSALERQTLFLATLVQLIRRHAADRPALRPAVAAPQSVARVQAYLDSCYARNVSLEELAHLAGLSAFHLTRVFHQTVGLPPHAYLNQVRVREARRLLLAGRPIAAVAFETGFADQSHLTRRFKRIVGVTPGQYILNSKNVQDKPA
ncbi:MAG: AraC family transcriptional regulator [Chloroflexota bacterium]